jgi:hypothetical protein
MLLLLFVLLLLSLLVLFFVENYCDFSFQGDIPYFLFILDSLFYLYFVNIFDTF